ncbi:unnamed protein product [Nezara viridula]|uniref:Chitinase 10 n=1 Tax=Nezara viridula TaxID=85310 RepID=A0A9P0E739_NEZVI|nr:unnamed protein product [Nezara viridula]
MVKLLNPASVVIKGERNSTYFLMFKESYWEWRIGLSRLFCLLLLCALLTETYSESSTNTVRRRLRRPSGASRVRDQETSASVNRFKVRNRISQNSTPVISRKSSNEGSSTSSKDSKDGYKVVCYYTNWSQYRPKIGKFLPEDIDPDLCTHIIFAFGWLKKGKLSSFESNDETKDGKIGLYERIRNLKKANPKLKTLLAIGGWSFGTQKFKDMSATRYSRQTFIYSAIPFLRGRSFDGLDIDWEYPKGGDDKKNFVLLLKELREAFEAEAQEVKKPRLLLSAAVPVGPDNVRGGYDVPAVAGYLDFINLMAYDFHGKWERETGHNAPLYSPSSDSEWRKQLSVSAAAELWTRLGAPKEKLIIGMPTYGRSFTISTPKNTVNSPASGGGKAGEYTKEAGFLAYYEICEMLRNGAAYIWDDEMKVPYCLQGDQWIGFDDEKSIRYKMKWLKESGYGGAMVWTIDMDDFTGTVCGNNVKYPLIGAIREELRGIKRGPNAQDVDWEKVAPSKIVQAVKPQAIKIPVTELLSKLNKAKPTVSNSIVPIQDTNTREAQVFCYLTSWSAKRPGAGRFSPSDLQPNLCTHVIYAFATLTDHKLAAATGTEDQYHKVVSLRDNNPNLKILLAIGGWAFGSTPFKELTSNVYRMNQFVYEAIEFLREYKFNGLDVDWEYPRGVDDRASYVSLLRELRTAFEGEAKTSGQPRLLLTAAVPASFEAIAAGYDVPEIAKYLDFINVMTYDFHGQWERQVGHNSPLYPLESATSYQKKLTVVCDFLHEDNTTLVWDNEQQVPFAYRGNQWVGFDDERSLKTKMGWLKEEGFGGIMIWSIDMDDFRGVCGNGKFPLVNAMKAELEEYAIKLEYQGPYEGPSSSGAYTTKDPNAVTCEEEDGHISYHPDKADCTMYYMCEGERKHHMPCPSNLVFNPNENVCDWPENVEGCTQHTQAPPPSR